jgi:DNA-binding MltR family transcriptional regulator
MEVTIEEKLNTLTNLASTLIDCVEILTRAVDDPEVTLSIAASLGAFVITEKREDAD